MKLFVEIEGFMAGDCIPIIKTGDKIRSVLQFIPPNSSLPVEVSKTRIKHIRFAEYKVSAKCIWIKDRYALFQIEKFSFLVYHFDIFIEKLVQGKYYTMNGYFQFDEGSPEFYQDKSLDIPKNAYEFTVDKINIMDGKYITGKNESEEIEMSYLVKETARLVEVDQMDGESWGTHILEIDTL